MMNSIAEVAHSANSLLATGRPEAARDLLREWADDNAAPASISHSYGWALIRSGDIDNAVSYLTHSTTRHATDAPLLIALSYAQERAGNPSEALLSAATALQHAPNNIEAGIACSRLAMAIGRADLAQQFATAAVQLDPTNRRSQERLSIAADACGAPSVARQAAEAVCSAAPHEVAPRLWLARMQERDGLLGDALESAAVAMRLAPSGNDQRVTAVSLTASLASRLGDQDRLRQLSAEISQPGFIDGLPEWILRLLFRVHTAAGRDDRARQLQQVIDAERSRSLKDKTLAQVLREVRSRRDPLPPLKGASAVAWSLADQGRWTVADWQTEALNGLEASKLVTEWWDCMPARRREIDALVDYQGLNSVRFAASNGRGFVVVTAHLGPAFAGLRVLHNGGVRAQMVHMADYLANAPEMPGDSAVPDINLAGREHAAVRQIVARLKAGDGVVTAADNVDAKDAATVPFLGHTARISTLAPRLAWRYGSATIWMVSEWQGERINVTFEPLPPPQAGEPEEAYIARWIDAYLSKIETCLRGNPRNLNIGSGIWQSFQ